MPIEIRELVIRTTVVDSPRPRGRNTAAPSAAELDQLRKQLVAECTQAVLLRLEKKVQR